MAADRSLSNRPFVFLSVSVPSERDEGYWHESISDSLPSGADRDTFVHDVKAANAAFVEDARADLIDESLVQLVRGLARRGWGLVSSGHPAVTPRMLQAVRELAEKPTEGGPWVILTQSKWFDAAATDELAGASEVELEVIEAGADQAASLTALHEAMSDRPNLRAGFFIGGTRGAFEAAALFRQHNPRAPMFAFGAPGGASRRLLDGEALLGHLHDCAAWADLQRTPLLRAFVTQGDRQAFTGAVPGHAGLEPDLLRSQDFMLLVDHALALAERVVPADDPDSPTLRAWINGDKRAGNQLFDKYYGPIDRFFRLKVDAQDREDLVHEVFIRLLKSGQTFEGRCTLRSHIYLLARRTLTDFYRKRKSNFDPLTDSIVDLGGFGASSALSRINRYAVLQTCIAELPIASRELIELYYWEEMSSRELGVVFGISAAAVRGRVLVVRQKLQEAYASKIADGGGPIDEQDLDTRLRELAVLFIDGPEPDAASKLS